MCLSLHKWRLDPERILQKDHRRRREPLETAVVVVVSTEAERICWVWVRSRNSIRPPDPDLFPSRAQRAQTSLSKSLSPATQIPERNRDGQSCMCASAVLFRSDRKSPRDSKQTGSLVIFCLPGSSRQTLTMSRLLAKEALERFGLHSHTFVLVTVFKHLIPVWTSTGAAGKAQKTGKILRSQGSPETDHCQKERGQLYLSIYLSLLPIFVPRPLEIYVYDISGLHRSAACSHAPPRGDGVGSSIKRQPAVVTQRVCS